MDLKAILIQASHVVESANLPQDLRPVAFAKVLQLMSGLEEPRKSGRVGHHVSDADAASLIERLAATLELTPHAVGEVFATTEDGALQLIVGHRKLQAAVAAAARQLAILVAGSRQLSGAEEWTNIAVIREACHQYGKFDQANFAGTIKKMDDVFGFRGTGQSREVRLNRAGAEELKTLVVTLSGGSV